MRFLVDEDTCPCLAVYLRHIGHDAEAVCDKGRAELVSQPDEVLMRVAARERRVIITFNTDDYVELHHDYQADGHAHWGIVTSPQRGHRDFEVVLGWVDKLLTDVPEPGFANAVHDLGIYASAPD